MCVYLLSTTVLNHLLSTMTGLQRQQQQQQQVVFIHFSTCLCCRHTRKGRSLDNAAASAIGHYFTAFQYRHLLCLALQAQNLVSFVLLGSPVWTTFSGLSIAVAAHAFWQQELFITGIQVLQRCAAL